MLTLLLRGLCGLVTLDLALLSFLASVKEWTMHTSCLIKYLTDMSLT